MNLDHLTGGGVPVLPARLLQVWPALPQAARAAGEGGPRGRRPPDGG
jgi:hypothetical protein